MTPLRCQVCDLEQTLAAPSCARCGASMDGAGLEFLLRSMRAEDDARAAPTSLLRAGEVDGPTVAGVAWTPAATGRGDATPGRGRAVPFRPTWTVPAPPPVPTADGWRARWRRLTGGH